MDPASYVALGIIVGIWLLADAVQRGRLHPGRWRLASIAHRRWDGIVVAMGAARAARVMRRRP